MVLRKTKLFRPCSKCSKMFCPTGKCNWVCPKCNRNRNSWLEELYKQQDKKKK